MKLASVAPYAATMSAVITPLLFATPETVTPFDGFALVTVTLSAPPSASLTLAMVEFDAALPC